MYSTVSIHLPIYPTRAWKFESAVVLYTWNGGPISLTCLFIVIWCPELIIIIIKAALLIIAYSWTYFNHRPTVIEDGQALLETMTLSRKFPSESQNLWKVKPVGYLRFIKELSNQFNVSTPVCISTLLLQRSSSVAFLNTSPWYSLI